MAAFVAFAWRDQTTSRTKPSVDYAGAGLLMITVVALLLGLMDSDSLRRWGLIIASVLLFMLLLWVERRAVGMLRPDHLGLDQLLPGVIHGRTAKSTEDLFVGDQVSQPITA